MKSLSILLVFLLLFSIICLCSENKQSISLISTSPSPINKFENGRLFQSSGNGKGHFNVIVLKGDWRQMGRQYGSLLKEQMGDFYQIASQNLKMSYDQIKNWSERFYDYSNNSMQEFISGTAETSGFSLEKQKIIFVLTSLIASESVNGCSTMSAWGKYTGERPLVIGKNWDYTGSFLLFKKFIIVAIFNPKESLNSVVTIGFVGSVYNLLTALNSNGMYIDIHEGVLSDPTIVRDLKRSLSFSEMISDSIFNYSSINNIEIRLLNRAVLPISGRIVNVADANQCHVYELATYDAKKRTGEGLIISTNHFIDQSWTKLPDIPSGIRSGFSVERITVLNALGEYYKGNIDAIHMMEIFDKNLFEGGATFKKNTIFQVVTVPFDKIIWVKIPGYCNWEKIDLNLFFSL